MTLNIRLKNLNFIPWAVGSHGSFFSRDVTSVQSHPGSHRRRKGRPDCHHTRKVCIMRPGSPRKTWGLGVKCNRPSFWNCGGLPAFKENTSPISLRNCLKGKEQQGFHSQRAQLCSHVPISNVLLAMMNRRMCLMEWKSPLPGYPWAASVTMEDSGWKSAGEFPSWRLLLIGPSALLWHSRLGSFICHSTSQVIKALCFLKAKRMHPPSPDWLPSLITHALLLS